MAKIPKKVRIFPCLDFFHLWLKQISLFPFMFPHIFDSLNSFFESDSLNSSKVTSQLIFTLGFSLLHVYMLSSLMRTSIDTLWDPKKLKFRFWWNPDPTFISETRTKGISNRHWPIDYNGIMNRRYKVWTPQRRIPDKFTVLEEPKEEKSLTFFYFYSIVVYYNECMLLIRHDWK